MVTAKALRLTGYIQYHHGLSFLLLELGDNYTTNATEGYSCCAKTTLKTNHRTRKVNKGDPSLPSMSTASTFLRQPPIPRPSFTPRPPTQCQRCCGPLYHPNDSPVVRCTLPM